MGGSIIAAPYAGVLGCQRFPANFAILREAALNKVSQLVADAGFEGVRVNDLKFARALSHWRKFGLQGLNDLERNTRLRF